MSKSTERRLAQLEQTMATTAKAETGKGHFIVVEPLEDPAHKIAALQASPEWEEGDSFVVWRIVDPKGKRAEQ
jgi:hypothetical protein